MTMTITDAASIYIKKMIAEENAVGFHLSVKKTGCSGYAYAPKIIKEINQQDIAFVYNGDLKVYVDPTSEKFLKGIVIDYTEDKNNGLKQKRLVFMNPNEKNRCGCGESFTIE